MCYALVISGTQTEKWLKMDHFELLSTDFSTKVKKRSLSSSKKKIFLLLTMKIKVIFEWYECRWKNCSMNFMTSLWRIKWASSNFIEHNSAFILVIKKYHYSFSSFWEILNYWIALTIFFITFKVPTYRFLYICILLYIICKILLTQLTDIFHIKAELCTTCYPGVK